MKSLKKLLFVIILLASLAGITPLLAEGRCGEFRVDPSDPGKCVIDTQIAWITAGQNNPADPRSNSWRSKLSYTYLKGVATADVSCRFDTFDKEGVGLLYKVYNSGTNNTSLNMGSGGPMAPGDTLVFKFTSPLGDDSPLGVTSLIGGPVVTSCRSTDPEALRNIVLFRSFSLYSPEGKKLGESFDKVNWTSSGSFFVPFMEGREEAGGENWMNGGLAVFNAASAEEAPGPVEVKVCLNDSIGNQGPCRTLVLNPATETKVGETKVVVLSTLFGTDLYFPYPNGTTRGDSIYGTLSVESQTWVVGKPQKTRIAVTVTALTNGEVVTGIPASPVSP
jgi:hypothetical protein